MRNKDKIKLYKLKLAKLNKKFSSFENKNIHQDSFKDYLLNELEGIKRDALVEYKAEIQCNIKKIEILSIIKNKITTGIELTNKERDFVLNYI
ncbi:hypothetical protein [Tenacibaculum soleae]|uniref:hypothetical protein n=1 Tax=Tenacibaculum soleae TaxID=447689 RepID=UPI0023019A12|nr:hypothetical protein [Tenacibaculum soleae]